MFQGFLGFVFNFFFLVPQPLSNFMAATGLAKWEPAGAKTVREGTFLLQSVKLKSHVAEVGGGGQAS